MSVVSVPEFLVATLAVLIFAVKLRWLPALSYASDVHSLGELLRSFAMPVMTLCCVIVAQMARMTPRGGDRHARILLCRDGAC